jgi:long-chain acyl-CoA synthetase
MTGTRPWLAHYDEGVPPSIDYQRLTVVEALQRSAAEHGGETALLFAGARLSYAELLAQVERMASTLAGLGLGPGGRLALHLPNLPQTAVAYYAALALGAQVVMSNPVYTDEELVPQWNDAGASIAVVADWIWADRIPRLARPVADPALDRGLDPRRAAGLEALAGAPRARAPDAAARRRPERRARHAGLARGARARRAAAAAGAARVGLDRGAAVTPAARRARRAARCCCTATSPARSSRSTPGSAACRAGARPSSPRCRSSTCSG